MHAVDPCFPQKNTSPIQKRKKKKDLFALCLPFMSDA
jgi:hypothetical protein